MKELTEKEIELITKLGKYLDLCLKHKTDEADKVFTSSKEHIDAAEASLQCYILKNKIK